MRKALSQLFQKKSNPEPLNDYLRWREVVFAVQSAQVGIVTELPKQVFGVIMDVGLSDDFIISISAFASGESSVRTTVGGGAIGLGGDESIAEHARHIVALAQSLIEKSRLADNHELPKSRMAYFYFLTTSGVMIKESTIEEISAQNHPFYEMFARFNAIKTRSEELTMA